MKYELIQEPNLYLTPKEQIAVNRGIKLEDVEHYFNTTEKDIIPYHFLNEEQLNKAAISIINSIKDSKQTLIIVDSDFDGYCSSSLFINYFYHFFPTWIKNCVKWIHHDSKSHGINDLLENILSMDTKPSLLIVPDAGTNDIEAHKILSDNGIEIIVLDHHLAEYTNEELFKNATIINNQICEYENKNLCGTGIVWQFCRYIDTMFICEEERYAEHFLDLVAAANTADMMSLLSFETKHLIKTGLKTNNIHNHLICRLWGKNSYKIGEELTSIDLAFYIAPLVNAVTRIGTLQEKEAVFNSMLDMLDLIEDESYISEAANICTRVRNRQVRIVNKAVEKIVPSLKDKFITILLDETESETKNVTGLIATKFSSKYNKPVLVLVKNIVDNKIRYSGSARGSDISGVNTFKDLCEKTELCEYAQGHQSAFGISILEENIPLFKDRLNKLLEPYDTESKYYVDYIFDGWSVIDPDLVLEIGSMKKDWGKDFRESLILIKDLKVNEDMITIMGNSTIKITMPCGIPIIYFNTKPEEINRIITKGYVKMNIICTCNINNWLGKLSPQLFLKDYEIIEESQWYF